MVVQDKKINQTLNNEHKATRHAELHGGDKKQVCEKSKKIFEKIN